jgi:hypothetical protein
MSDDNARIPGPAADGPAEAGGRMIPLRLLAWLPWIAAGGFALLAGFLSQAYFAAQSEMIALREQGTLASLAGKGLQQRIEAERILSTRRLADQQAGLPDPGGPARLKIFHLISASGSAAPVLAVAAWDPVRQEGELFAINLPPPAPDKDYQLWIMDPGYPDLVGAGVLAVGMNAGDVRIPFKADRPVATAARFSVSLERKGGVPRAEGPMILSSQ